jgi:hypothetical protein
LLTGVSALSAARITKLSIVRDYQDDHMQAFVPKGAVMSKNWVMLTGLLLAGWVGTSQAHPLDSPDLVYIDGLPCNRACQSYMAWSRQRTSSVAQEPAPGTPAPRASTSAVDRAIATRRANSKPAAKLRISRQAVSLPPAKAAERQPAADTASESARANIAASSPAVGAAATSDARTVREQVAAATRLAEHVTAASAAPVPQQEANNAGAGTETAQPSDNGQTASVAANTADNLVALLMARPEIKSVADLAGKAVAIEGQQTAPGASIRTAIAAAGAVEVQLSEGKAFDRLTAGEVQAAILTLVSPEAAEGFPDIPGYRIFRIPLSPRSLKARL